MKLSEADNVLVLSGTQYNDRHRCRNIGGGRWNPEKKQWLYPLDKREDIEREFPEVVGFDFDLDFDYEGPTDSITYRGEEPYDHQRRGTAFVLDGMRRGVRGCMLLDQMGVGKTAQAIWAFTNSGLDRMIVVCPATVMFNWVEALQTFGVFRDIIVYHGPKAKRERLDSKLTGRPRIAVVTSYDMWRLEHQSRCKGHQRALLTAAQGQFMVVDEAHYVKNEETARSEAIERANAAFSVLMTGTPVAKGPEDLYNLIHLCNPTPYRNRWQFNEAHLIMDWFLNQDDPGAGREAANETRREFRNKRIDPEHGRAMMESLAKHGKAEMLEYLWCLMNYRMIDPTHYRQSRHKWGLSQTAEPKGRGFKKVVAYKNLDLLRANLQMCAIRRMRDQVLKDLPGSVQHIRTVAMGKKQKIAYKKMRDELLYAFDAQDEQTFRAEKAAWQTRILRLQQITSGILSTGVEGENEILETPKDAIIDELLETEEQLVVWAYFKPTVKRLAEKYDAAIIIGGQTPKARDKEIKSFQHGEKRVIVGQVEAGGIGINELVVASCEVFYDIPQTPKEYSQAADRLDRIGQKKLVNIVLALVEESVDMKRYAVLKARLAVADQITAPRPVTRQDLRELLL